MSDSSVWFAKERIEALEKDLAEARELLILVGKRKYSLDRGTSK